MKGRSDRYKKAKRAIHDQKKAIREQEKAMVQARNKALAEARALEKTRQNSMRPLLRIPPEIRLIIYSYAMVNNWDLRMKAMEVTLGSVYAADKNEDTTGPIDWTKRMKKINKQNEEFQKKKAAFARISAEPALLRVCRRIRLEGMKSYYNSLKTDKKLLIKQAIDAYKRVKEKMAHDAPIDNVMDDDAESMALVFNYVPDVEKEMRKLEYFGHAAAHSDCEDGDEDGEALGEPGLAGQDEEEPDEDEAPIGGVVALGEAFNAADDEPDEWYDALETLD